MPTEQEIADARHNVTECLEWADIYDDNKRAMRVLLAATDKAPPIDDHRPEDPAELARKVAEELRKRGIWADTGEKALMPAIVRTVRAKFDDVGKHRPYSAGWDMSLSDFDNLGPLGCADVIQRQESKRAREWAGDK